jgi:hypothetical protein
MKKENPKSKPLKVAMSFDDAMRLVSKIKPPEKKPAKRKK